MFDLKGYDEAKSIDEAIGFLKDEDSMIIAGGTDILIKLREGKAGYTEKNFVGITRIPEMKQIKVVDGDILIGPAATFTEVELNDTVLKNIKSLSTAVGTVGGPQVRNAGTIGGNVCNGATSADSASTLFALNAKLVIKSASGEREVNIQDFYKGPGKVDLNKGELLTAIKIKKEDYEGYKGHYIKFSQRNAMDIATLGCSVLVKKDGNKIADLRVAFGVAGPTPLRATSAEEFAKGKELNDENIKQIAEKCLENCKARDSWRASKAFRENLVVELTQRAIKTAINEG